MRRQAVGFSTCKWESTEITFCVTQNPLKKQSRENSMYWPFKTVILLHHKCSATSRQSWRLFRITGYHWNELHWLWVYLFPHQQTKNQRIPCSGWPFANWTRKTLEITAHHDRRPHPGDVDMAVLWEFYHIRAWAMTYLLKLAPKINACELIIKETPTSRGKTLVPMNPALLGWI